MAYKLAQGDTGSKLRITCKNDNDGMIIDLTAATVHLLWRDAAGVQIQRTMTIINPPTGGIAEYQFAATEIFPPSMAFRVRITDAAAKILHNLEALVEDVIPTP